MGKNGSNCKGMDGQAHEASENKKTHLIIVFFEVIL